MLEQEITVLIVDDEEEIRSGLRRVIQRRYPDLRFLDSAANGAEGLERIRAFLPDIVIADINMPMISGLEMIRQAREDGYAGSFVLLSGYDDFKYAQSAIRYASAASIPSLITERTSLWLAGMVMAFRAALQVTPKSSRSISNTLPKLPSPMRRVICQAPKMGSYCL